MNNRYYTYRFGKKVISEITNMTDDKITLEDNIGCKITIPRTDLKELEEVK